MKYKKIIKEYFIDIKKLFVKPIEIEAKKSIKIFSVYFFITFLLVILNSISNAVLTSVFDITYKSFNNTPLFYKVVILGPIIEEYTFRAFLKKTRFNYIALFGGLGYFFLHIFFTFHFPNIILLVPIKTQAIFFS